MSTKSIDTKIKHFPTLKMLQYPKMIMSQFPNIKTSQFTDTKIKPLSNAMSTPEVLTEQAQLEYFIQRAHEAKIHTQETGHGDAWEVLDGAQAKNAQDEDEWVVVEHEAGRIAEMA